jgi:DNA-binding SARP family transcriptional activator
MSVLRLAVLGPPEVFHDGSRLTFGLRKAQAVLLYLAVEGGLHSRSKLAALLWPDSEPQVARKALRNALALLRNLLAAPAASPAQHSHLLSEGELLGLDPKTPRELDLDVVQQAYTAAQRLTTPPAEEQRAALVTGLQQALAVVRGPFLDGFWLGEDAPFDEWVRQQQQQWQVRLQLLYERLSAWQEASGELEQVKATLVRWLALDPLAEEAYRRLMRVHLALGDPTAAARVYATCRARLAEELQVKPSAETVALAEHIRASAARRGSLPDATPAQRRPPGELVTPLVGRQASFSHLVESFQQARQGQPQAVLVVGEAGIGKTRLAREWVAWAAAQGADVLAGHAFEIGGRLPYQPLVEALRPRLEAENAPEDLLEDLWLAELSRLLPELRVRYPDLPTPTEDELTAKGRLFEAVARLFDALSQSGPLVLLLDDLQWVDEASLDLVRYLGHYWKEHSSRVLLLGTLRSEGLELNPQLSTQLVDLGRDLPISQVRLQPLSREETLQLVQAIVGAASAAELGTKLSALSEVLFAQTEGQPLYLLETLRLLRDRQWLVPRVDADGAWRLELAVGLATIVAQEQSQGALLPPSVRALILARLASLSQAARHLVQGGAVLARAAPARLLWQLAELGVQEGVEALEEAVKGGILREEEPGGGRLGSYRFAHDLMREVVYTELGAARRQILHQRALVFLQTDGTAAAELGYHARAAGETEAALGYSVQAGDEAMAVFAVADAIGHYEHARSLLQEHQRMSTVLLASEVEHLYAHLGRAYAFQNAWQQAQDAYKELLAYARQKPLPALVSMTLNRLAILALQQSQDKPQVQALLDEAWHIAEGSHDQKAQAETEWNLAQITGIMWEDFTSSLLHGQQALSLARARHDQELEGRCLFTLGVIHLIRGDFEETMHCAQASLALYAALGDEATASRELSLPSFLSGAPLTQPLTHRATEALCWAVLASAQVHTGQVLVSMRSGRQALALAQESKSVWVQLGSTTNLAHGLLDAGAYEEALGLIQHTMALARTLPPTINFQNLLTGLGRTYHALQQWEEARSTLEEAEAMAETLELKSLHVPVLSQLCMHYAVAGQWEAACRYAAKAVALRKSLEKVLFGMDFYSHYETEALMRGGEESQARAAVQRLGEGLGPNRRYRIPYLRSLATLAAWEGHSEQAIGHLREAATLAADLGLPGEQWQIQAALGSLYEAVGEQGQAHIAWASAARIIQELAQGIKDEALCSRFLTGPQIQPVVQHAQSEVSPVPNDHTEPSKTRPYDRESEKDVL